MPSQLPGGVEKGLVGEAFDAPVAQIADCLGRSPLRQTPRKDLSAEYSQYLRVQQFRSGDVSGLNQGAYANTEGGLQQVLHRGGGVHHYDHRPISLSRSARTSSSVRAAG